MKQLLNVAVGSLNRIKVEAVAEVLPAYPLFSGHELRSFGVPSDVAEQPLSLSEIILGANNRARHAFQCCLDCRYSFGIESGLFEASGTQSGYLEACICSVHDGINYYIGMSCGFEIPSHILKAVLDDKLDLSQASLQSGITQNTHLGSAEGLIGILSNGRIDRKAYTKQSIMTALIQLENSQYYSNQLHSYEPSEYSH